MLRLTSFICRAAPPIGLSPLGVFIVSALLAWTASGDEAPLRQRVNFDPGWQFRKGEAKEATDLLAYPKIKDALLASSKGFLRSALNDPVPAAVGKEIAYTQADFDDSTWRHLDIPHDWAIEGPFDVAGPGETGKLPYWGVGWYRKDFELPAAVARQRYCLDIEWAMSYAAMWCNGQFVVGWPYGYTSWQVDLTPYLKPGRRTSWPSA